jgi:uncharacterized RDD family membrane protein YckC
MAVSTDEQVEWSSRRRGVSWTIDAVLVCGVALGGVTAAGAEVDWLMSAPGVCFVLALGFVYLGWLTSRFGQSLGKRVTRLRVVRADGRPPGRLRLLGRAALDMATVGIFILACDTLGLDRYGGENLLTALAGALILPGFLIAWWLRDNLLDLQLVHG